MTLDSTRIAALVGLARGLFVQLRWSPVEMTSDPGDNCSRRMHHLLGQQSAVRVRVFQLFCANAARLCAFAARPFLSVCLLHYFWRG